MSFKKCIGLVTVAMVGGALVVACSSSDTSGGNNTTTDSGTGVIDSGRRDTGTVTPEDTGTGGTCTPQPVPGYTPAKYPPPKQQPKACTDAEIAKIANDCAADFTAAACQTDLLGTGGVSATCQACAVTPETATNWGPFVKMAGDAGAADIMFQNAGCIDIVTGVPGCGQAYYGVVDCITESCKDPSCGDDPNVEPAKTCTTDALKSVCKPYLVSAACGQGLGKADLDTTCFGQPVAVVTGVLNANCGSYSAGASDAGPG